MQGLNPETDAEELLRTYWSREGNTIVLPVDPVAIAGRLGIRVFTASLDANISGMLIMAGGSDPEIYLSRSDSYNRQRFTCGHELGHWAQNVAKGIESAEITDFRGPLSGAGTNSSEIYANQFAAALLMPAEEVHRLKEQGYGTAAVADTLRVSPDAAAFRITNLKAG
jgi:Zn-dependent peptidase ImmA (M78 family)